MSVTTNVLLDSALQYAALGFHILPLHYPIINKNGVFCTCKEGSDCPSIGKHPQYHETLIAHGVYDATTDETTIRAWWSEWPKANIGIATGAQSDLFVCDADSLIIVNDAEQKGLPLTPRVRTGNGEHAWFKHPGIPVPNKVKVDGFDFRGDGGLIVAPPSLHHSGRRYDWIVSLDTPLAGCPPWISALITKSPEYTQSAPTKIASEDTRYGLGALKRAVKRIEAANNGHRNDTFYQAAASIYNLVAGGELTDATADFELRSAADTVGLTSAEIAKTFKQAKQNGSANPRTAPAALTGSQLIERALTKLGYKFRLNDCADILEVNDQYLNNALEAKILTQMRDLGFKNDNVLRNAMLSIALDNHYHPIKEYLNDLKWDSKDRIRALAKHLPDIHPLVIYADNSRESVCYVYLKRWLIGAVAKVFNGSQNAMLVFVGKQNSGKSSLACYLGSCLPQHFITDRIDPNDKDHMLRLASTFVWDVDELDATTKKADVAAIKSFITRPIIDVRRAFDRRNTRKPACVSFIGTVNDNGAGFLMDETGSRRFMVLELSHIDFAYSQIDVHQLWAQAVAMYRAGETGLLTDLERGVRDEINSHYEPRDLIEDSLLRYFDIDPQSNDFLSTLDILHHLTDNCVAIKGEERATSMKLAKAAKRLGLEKHSSGLVRGYKGISLKPVEIRLQFIKKTGL